MKKKFYLLYAILISIPGIILAQNNQTAVPSVPASENTVVDPDKFLFAIGLGLGILFILFIIFALSRATASLSESLKKEYKSKTQFVQRSS